MPLLYWFESIRHPVLDTVMSVVTRLGEEFIFLGIALLVFWCLDKHRGYTLMLIGFVGITVNQVLKLTFRIPRPWVLDPEFSVVEGTKEAATGYSFPSGHTQNATDTFGYLARMTRRTWLRVALVVALLLVALSRMYLGVHTPLDTGVSLLIGGVLVLFISPLVDRAVRCERAMWWMLGGMAFLSLAFLTLCECYFSTVAEMDAVNLHEGQKNAYTMLGCTLGMLIVYAFDRHVRPIDTTAPFWGQVLKLVVGLALALLIKQGLKAPLATLFGGHLVTNAIRYLLVVVFAGVLWPLTFPLFAKIGTKK